MSKQKPKEPRFMVTYTRRWARRDPVTHAKPVYELEPVPFFSTASAQAEEVLKSAHTVTIEREIVGGINDGKFFLYLIVK